MDAVYSTKTIKYNACKQTLIIKYIYTNFANGLKYMYTKSEQVQFGEIK
jgi:hypothetical protein